MAFCSLLLPFVGRRLESQVDGYISTPLVSTNGLLKDG
jgi:hypothetical protein